MSLYNFSNTSPVQEIVFHHAKDRPPVALVSAAQNTTRDELSIIRNALEANRWTCDAVSVEGKEVLQISGFTTEQQLLNFMQASHFSEGTPQFTPEQNDHAKRTTGEWLQANGLKLGGWLNLLGDGGLLASGIMSRRPHVITAGALYTAGAGVLARYGNVQTEYHVRQVLEKTGDFLQKQSIPLPEDCGLSTIMKQKQSGMLPDAERVLYNRAPEVMLGAYTLGALTMLQSGIKQGNSWGIAYGANSVAMKAASLLIREKHKTEEEKKASRNQGLAGKFMDWAQEKPMRIFGFGSILSDTMLGFSGWKDYKTDKNKLGAIFTMITSGTYVLADLLFAISHKDHTHGDGKFDADEQRRIVALTAEAISHQPKQIQITLAQNAAGFLSTQPEMSGTVFDISRSIKEQLTHIDHNPWTHRIETDTFVAPAISNR